MRLFCLACQLMIIPNTIIMNIALKLLPVALALPMLAGCAGEKGGAASEGISNPVTETIMARRSIRAYKSVPVSRDTLDVILECGINAPSAMNNQNWEVRMVDNINAFGGIVDSQTDGQSADLPGLFHGAPAVAFVANKAGAAMSEIDCALLGENMLLAAKSLGIGTCFMGWPVNFFKSDAGKPYLEKLGFSEGYELLYVISFGYPTEDPEAKPRDASKARYVDFQ